MRSNLFIFNVWVALWLAGLSGPAQSQEAAHWRFYRMGDGMAESACRWVTANASGKLLVRHLNTAEITELDGYRARNLPAPAGTSSPVFQNPSGQIWSLVPDGLAEYRESQNPAPKGGPAAAPGWIIHRVREISEEYRSGRATPADPLPLLPVRHGVVLFLTPSGLFEFNTEDPQQPRTTPLLAQKDTPLGAFSSLAPGRDGGLWIAGAGGVLKSGVGLRLLKPGTPWNTHALPPDNRFPLLKHPIEDTEGTLTMVAVSSDSPQTAVLHYKEGSWSERPTGTERILKAWRGVDGTDWAMSSEAVFWWPRGSREMALYEEMTARQFFDVAAERSGVFWVANSDGLYCYVPLPWQAPYSPAPPNLQVRLIGGSRAGQVLVCGGSSLYSLEPDQMREYPIPAEIRAQLGVPKVLCELSADTWLLAGAQSAVLFEIGTGSFRPLSDHMNASAAFVCSLPGGRVLLQRGAGEIRLEIFDGERFDKTEFPAPPEGLGRNILSGHITREGVLWLTSPAGIGRLEDDHWTFFDSEAGDGPAGGVAFIELPDRRLWCSTAQELWVYSGAAWNLVRRGFDQVNAMLLTAEGKVWIASNNGLHLFTSETWLEQTTDEGLPSGSVRALFEDARGQLWTGTSRGLAVYRPAADSQPPRTFILPPNDSLTLSPDSVVNVRLQGVDHWKQTARGRLLYSHKLDQQDWSPFQEQNAFSFSDLPAGKHVFQARAIDRNGNIETATARLDFSVVLPWYKEVRILWISLLALAGVLFFAALAVNRHRQLLRSYAEVENKVRERSRELELAHQELLQSQKMKALGTLSAGIAHDFNNILSIVKGSAQIIEDNVGNPDKVRTRVDRIKTVVDQGAGIVKAMLGFSRDSDQELAECDINAVVGDTLKLLGDRFLREVQIRFEAAPGLPRAISRPGFVQQILLNFIFNAAESMTTAPRQIILRTAAASSPPQPLALVPEQAPGYLLISVQDFGTGISLENLPRIFEPFFTTKALSTRRGTGLGLSMAYELATRLKAGLAVSTQVDRGSIFTLVLPVQPVAVSDEAKAHQDP